MKEIEELFERSFPFWGSLTEEEQAEMILGTTRNKCGKKNRLHFGGGECAGVQIIEKGRARIFITSPNGGDITLFRLMDGDVSILYSPMWRPALQAFFWNTGRWKGRTSFRSHTKSWQGTRGRHGRLSAGS